MDFSEFKQQVEKHYQGQLTDEQVRPFFNTNYLPSLAALEIRRNEVKDSMVALNVLDIDDFTKAIIQSPKHARLALFERLAQIHDLLTLFERYREDMGHVLALGKEDVQKTYLELKAEIEGAGDGR